MVRQSLHNMDDHKMPGKTQSTLCTFLVLDCHFVFATHKKYTCSFRRTLGWKHIVTKYTFSGWTFWFRFKCIHYSARCYFWFSSWPNPPGKDCQVADTLLPIPRCWFVLNQRGLDSSVGQTMADACLTNETSLRRKRLKKGTARIGYNLISLQTCSTPLVEERSWQWVVYQVKRHRCSIRSSEKETFKEMLARLAPPGVLDFSRCCNGKQWREKVEVSSLAHTHIWRILGQTC